MFMGKKCNIVISFVLRTGIGLMLVYIINGILATAGYTFSVGIGITSALISGLLGAPGILLLYGISFCAQVL